MERKLLVVIRAVISQRFLIMRGVAVICSLNRETSSPFTIALLAGMTTNVRMADDTIPPVIGTAMRCMTSEPVPWLHKIGSKPAMMATTVSAAAP